MRYATRMSLVAGLLPLFACGDATRVVAPDELSAARAASAAASTPLVTGSGHFSWADGPDAGTDGGWRTFTLNVVERADGSVRGHFQLVNREQVSQLKGTVFCAARDASRPGAVYAALRITESTNPTQVNALGFVWVQDNGSGSTATGPDRATGVITRVGSSYTPTEALSWCAGAFPTFLGFSPFDTEAGNFTVR